MLYVSHDRYFINQTATRILELVNQTFVNYIGNYDYYLEKKEELTAAYAGISGSGASLSDTGNTESASGSSSRQDWQERKEAQARERKRQNDLQKMEARISELEERSAAIDELMTQEDVYTNSVRCQELAREKTDIEKELENLYETWETLAE